MPMKNRCVSEKKVLVTYRDLAEILGVSPSQVFALVRRGQLPLKKINLGGCVRFSREEAEQWIQQGCPKRREGRAD